MDLLELLGSGYVIEHCVSAFSERQKEKSFKVYVTDCLQAIAANTMHIVGMNGVFDYGSKPTKRWIDLMESEKPKKEDPQTEKSTEELVDDMWNRMFGDKHERI